MTERGSSGLEQARSRGLARRLGRNVNGYLGETIEIATVLSQCVSAARAHGWSFEDIRASESLNLLALKRGAPEPTKLRGGEGERTKAGPGGPHIYLSTGIHGDEPAGPLAMLQLLSEDPWPAGALLSVCPCLNPSGFQLNRRENAQGMDLNREYLNPSAKETLAHIRWLEQQPPFDLCLCLHEDWESHGFYVYELNPDDRPSLSDTIVAAAGEACPVDLSDSIEGRPAHKGIIRPSIDPRSRPQWPEAFFLLTRKTRLSYTLEAPSDFPLATRVAALVLAVQAAVQKFMKDYSSRAKTGLAVHSSD